MTGHEAEQTIVIDRRFCGPPDSGNGGYVCGRLAHYIDGCALVRLASPPPLDRPLQIRTTAQGVALLDGDRLVAQARPHFFEMAVPPCPTLVRAQQMSEHYAGFSDHAFSTCFVCGPDRPAGDGLRIFPGSSPDSSVVGCPWRPAPSLADERGQIPSWAVWSALDCPGGWSFLHASGQPALLGEFSVHIDSAITAEQELIVLGWEIEHSGRKHRTGSALYTTGGEVLARGLATWIELA